MSTADYLKHFYSTNYNWNVSGYYFTAWTQLGNAKAFGIPGTSAYCGANCSAYYFTIKNTSAVAISTVYLTLGLHRAREYGYKSASASWYSNDDASNTGCNLPFIATKNPTIGATPASLSNYCKFGTAAKVYNDATVWNAPFSLAAGATYTVAWEVDFNRPNIQNDIAISARASGAGLTITHTNATGVATGKASDPGYPRQ